jgi:organic hydroperoxide reductase OsmC/OhrA
MALHQYKLSLTWTGNRGEGTASYKSYDRSHEIKAGDKPAIPGSSDPSFRGDPSRYNPEEMLVASLSACHMLWYLHLATTAGVMITAYTDEATGTMEETANGGGRFTEVTLHPVITVKEQSMIAIADTLHEKTNELCFIANSVNFPVHHQPTYQVG